MHGITGTMKFVPTGRKEGCFTTQEWESVTRSFMQGGRRQFVKARVRFDDSCKNGHNTFSVTGDIWEAGTREEDRGGGCIHDEIARCFPEIAHLIKWHLVSTDGPMHYAANTVYHALEHGPTHAWVRYTLPADPLGILGTNQATGYVVAEKARLAETTEGYTVEWDPKTSKERNLDYARSSAVWPEATDAELCADPATLTAQLEARLPALLADFRRDVEACGLRWI